MPRVLIEEPPMLAIRTAAVVVLLTGTAATAFAQWADPLDVLGPNPGGPRPNQTVAATSARQPVAAQPKQDPRCRRNPSACRSPLLTDQANQNVNDIRNIVKTIARDDIERKT